VAGGASGDTSWSRDDARAIQSHIDDCDGCRLVLAEAVRSTRQTQPAAGPSFRTLADGQCLLGRYQIRRFIARGGMGEVYEAFDTVLGEVVALKTLLLTSLDDERAIERLADEVRLARKVTHPNVCRILEFGRFEPAGGPAVGIPFLTMEFLQGESLSCRIAARGALGPICVGKLVREMIGGLAAIHAAGIVHRDFKSQNVFLVREQDGDERAVIMDFGLARAFGDDARGGSSSAAAGTPDYMAPEQVEGKPPSPAFDIYAFGVVAFELLTGRKPFTAASPYMAALSRLQRRAPAPSQFMDGLAPIWDSIIGRCLDRDPARRFGRVEDIAATLRATERPRWSPRRTRILGALAALGLTAFAAVLSSRDRIVPSDRASRALTEQPRAEAHTPPAPVVFPVAPLQTRLPASRPRPRPAPGGKPRLADPAGTARAALLQAEALMLGGEVARACQLGEGAAGKMPSLPAAHLFLARCYVRLGDSATARRHYRQYLDLAPNAPDQMFVKAILEGAK
jgi:serine/threonine protein kinase